MTQIMFTDPLLNMTFVPVTKGPHQSWLIAEPFLPLAPQFEYLAYDCSNPGLLQYDFLTGFSQPADYNCLPHRYMRQSKFSKLSHNNQIGKVDALPRSRRRVSARRSRRREKSEKLQVQYPVRCEQCLVTLNAPKQAYQHFEGKTHRRITELQTKKPAPQSTMIKNNAGVNKDPADVVFSCTDPDITSTKSSKEVSLDNAHVISFRGGVNANCADKQDIGAQVYCSTCAVSFNSVKQAEQHYRGKIHTKKTRQRQNTERNRLKKIHKDLAMPLRH